MRLIVIVLALLATIACANMNPMAPSQQPVVSVSQPISGRNIVWGDSRTMMPHNIVWGD